MIDQIVTLGGESFLVQHLAPSQHVLIDYGDTTARDKKVEDTRMVRLKAIIFMKNHKT